MSKIDFTPAHITATGVLPSSVKSALISKAVNNNLFIKQENQNTEISEKFWIIICKISVRQKICTKSGNFQKN